MKIVKYILIVLMLLSLSVCSKKKQELKVGLDPDYPPFEYKESGVLTGFDVELMREIGTRIGYKICFQEMEFNELFTALEEGKIDVAISAISINEQRKQFADFTIPYFSSDQAIIRAQNRDFKILEEADIAKYNIGAQEETTGLYYLQLNLLETGVLSWEQLFAYSSTKQALSALLNGDIDLLILDETAAKAFSAIKPVEICYTIPTDEEYGIAMKKGCKLKTNIDNALHDIMRSSLWTQLLTEYMSK